MHRQTLALLLVAGIAFAGTSSKATADVPKPAYRVGDFWAYATNLTEPQLGLAFDGASRVEVVRFGDLVVQGSPTPIAELLLTGGGTFSGSSPGNGTATGTWSITGTEAWETGSWKSVRSFFRLTAGGEITGIPLPVSFTLAVISETTRRTISDDWAWPVAAGSTGTWLAHWNASQNITFAAQGTPPGWNASSVEGDFTTTYAHERTEAITVPAGSFEADVIREEGPEGGHRLRWYAPRAGNDVRQDEYNETGILVASARLVDYAYAAGAGEPSFPWLIALNVALGLAAVVLLAAVAVRRKRNRVEVWMPPESNAESRSQGRLP